MIFIKNLHQSGLQTLYRLQGCTTPHIDENKSSLNLDINQDYKPYVDYKVQDCAKPYIDQKYIKP